MIRWLAWQFGYRVQYVCDWGVYSWRYDSIDAIMMRPIHRAMSVAPPWAKIRFVRIDASGKGEGR